MELERRAIELKNAGRLDEAAQVFSTIVEEQPDWEHGTAFHDLAQCHEDMGNFVLAERYYKAALQFEPTSDIFLGAYASFLYLHGNPEDAFDAYSRLLRTHNSEGFTDQDKSYLIALDVLGRRIGWTDAFIAEKIAELIS